MSKLRKKFKTSNYQQIGATAALTSNNVNNFEWSSNKKVSQSQQSIWVPDFVESSSYSFFEDCLFSKFGGKLCRSLSVSKFPHYFLKLRPYLSEFGPFSKLRPYFLMLRPYFSKLRPPRPYVFFVLFSPISLRVNSFNPILVDSPSSIFDEKFKERKEGEKNWYKDR